MFEISLIGILLTSHSIKASFYKCFKSYTSSICIRNVISNTFISNCVALIKPKNIRQFITIKKIKKKKRNYVNSAVSLRKRNIVHVDEKHRSHGNIVSK